MNNCVRRKEFDDAASEAKVISSATRVNRRKGVRYNFDIYPIPNPTTILLRYVETTSAYYRVYAFPIMPFYLLD